MTDVTGHTLEVPGAELRYDVRGKTSSTSPTLVLVGSPMGASGFGTLAGHFGDRRVVTYDPRGVDRSRRTDGAARSTPDEHADDLHRLVSALGTAPVDVFASSGGAVNALAMVARHPEQVRTLVAHEPPVADVLPDREHALAACRAIHDTYLRRGFGPAMAMFIRLVSHKGEITADLAAEPAPDPAAFGLPVEDDGGRDDALLGQNLLTCTHYQVDVEALRTARSCVVLAVGAGSEGELAHRAGVAVGERLGSPARVLPGDHGGFLGGEYGRTGEPERFAAALREVLDAEPGPHEASRDAVDRSRRDRASAS